MKELEERILSHGKVYPGNILKVDSFLNHQVDIDLTKKMAEKIHEHFKYRAITKVLTIEASGIPVAFSVAELFKVPMIFAKKSKSLTIGDDLFSSQVCSYTHNTNYSVTVSKRYLGSNDKVLIVDDFLALGNATKGLIDICNQAEAFVEGIAVCIEKGFQPGGNELRMMGYDVMSLAIIESMSEEGKITFQN